jgi:hypothetical protein
MKEIKVPSGAEVKLAYGGFQASMNLKRAISEAVTSQGDLLKGLDEDSNISEMIPLVLAADSSERVHDCIFECLKKSTYNKEKITKNTFDENEDMIQDYYPIVIACIKRNLSPFFPSLFSKFEGQIEANLLNNLKQK